jgi:hypothetical protein
VLCGAPVADIFLHQKEPDVTIFPTILAEQRDEIEDSCGTECEYCLGPETD